MAERRAELRAAGALIGGLILPRSSLLKTTLPKTPRRRCCRPCAFLWPRIIRLARCYSRVIHNLVDTSIQLIIVTHIGHLSYFWRTYIPAQITLGAMACGS